MTRITELRSGKARVRIAPALGGRLTAAWLETAESVEMPVLHPYPESELGLLPWPKGGMFALIPYSGRIDQARLFHEGKLVELTAHPGGEPHTLHGIAQQRPWTLVQESDGAAMLRYRHQPDSHWPWQFEAALHVTLLPRRLSVEVSLVNLDSRSMPAGIGVHPYVPCSPGDSMTFEAGPGWKFDAAFLAVERMNGDVHAVAVSAGRLAEGDLTLFHGEWSGDLCLHRCDGGALRFTADGSLQHLVVHRPAQAPYVCIEPVSHVADGFNLHARGVAKTGTRVLMPGEAMSGRANVTSSDRVQGGRARGTGTQRTPPKRPRTACGRHWDRRET